ncbi:hypothetical protein BGZ61DRAFT_502206 [Ilyonectria robusta]|uniref:uncharacterized protein n=1 Tax=Ilyonectria robusta TaxID=1079257 RepID=UPI001E8EE02C|nr:uncharacterized protein BGZ61DRAFT_502206 [Ilyonectria robusta]KAH8738303.1 hypothetical protein BGZ61DRAFT_502206 [Ilyonectria robusta]
MHSAVQRALLRWHGFLRLPRHPQSWYKDRLREEICERRLATTPFQKLNETADVFYIISRVQYDSHALRRLPDFILPHLVVYAYLLSKYTSRWQFYRVAASYHKVREVACRHGIDPTSFIRVCRRLRMVWPLLP